MRNRTGPKIVPWGIPDETVTQLEYVSLILTLWHLFCKKDLNQPKTLPFIPALYNLHSNLSCGTQSKAREISRYTISIFCFMHYASPLMWQVTGFHMTSYAENHVDSYLKI